MRLKVIALIIATVVSAFSQSYHADKKTTSIHTPFRWVWADSATRVAQAVTGRDTMKLGYQEDDYSLWYLSDSTPTWHRVGTYKADSLLVGNTSIKPTNVTTDTLNAGRVDIDTIEGPVVITGTDEFKDSVGMGTNEPDGRLHVYEGSAGAFAANGTADDFVIEDSANAGMSIVFPDGKVGTIYFGTASNVTAAMLRWDYTTKLFTIGTKDNSGEISFITSNNTEAMRIDASQNITTSGTLQSTSFTTNGDDYFTYDTIIFKDTIKEGAAFLEEGLSKIVKVGNKITYKSGYLTNPSYTGGALSIPSIPSEYIPSGTSYIPAIISNNGNYQLGIVRFNGGVMYIFTSSFANLDAGDSGLIYAVITWIL